MNNTSERYTQFVDRRKTTRTFLLVAIFTSFFLGIVSTITGFILGSNVFLGLGVVSLFLFFLHQKGYYRLSGYFLVAILPLVTTFLVA